MFSVWEKDAKDESGFVGYCYLDLFPRGMSPHADLLRIQLTCVPLRVQVLTRGCLAPSARARHCFRRPLLPTRGDGREPREADALEARSGGK